MRHHARRQNARITPRLPLMIPKPPAPCVSVTDPGTSAIISTENDIIVALTTTTAAAAAPCFIKASLRELVALPLSVEPASTWP